MCGKGDKEEKTKAGSNWLNVGERARRSDSVIGQNLNEILDCHNATRRDQAGSRYPAPGARVTFRHAQDRVSCTQRYLRLLWQYVAFSQQCSVGGHDRFALVEKGVRVAQTTVCVVRFGFLPSATLVILTTTHRTTPWVCQSIRVLAAVAEGCGSSSTRSTSVQFPWQLESSSTSSFCRLCSSLLCPGFGLECMA